ncbi:MAG: YlmH/Sll1252 family protein [Erysipelotrichaceae bacterium]|nr:YlmH/Sll1252 family protein [Erysipelotrichaceae bacterium]MDY5251692.1 YlmH/Sll1252 family protein [Erysipelotrichaceae bacterium]
MMTNLQHFKGHELLIARLDDLRARAEKYHKTIASNFLSEEEVAVAQRYLGKQCTYKLDGGYQQAQRCKVVFLMEEDDFFDVVCLSARFNTKYASLKHPDVLGALMGLNIERDQIGDIFVKDDRIIIFVSQNIADYIIINLRQIKRSKVTFEVTNVEDLDLSLDFKIFQTTISSERLDVIVSAICKINRSQAQKLIVGKQVQLNHVTIEDCAKLCNNNCTISIRRYGRFIYQGIDKTTKKDRLLVTFKQYI